MIFASLLADVQLVRLLVTSTILQTLVSVVLQSVELTIPGCTPVAEDICTSERGNRAAVPRPTTTDSTRVVRELSALERGNRAAVPGPTTTDSTHVARELSALERDNRAAVPGPTTTDSTHVAGEGCISEQVNRAGSQLKEQYLQIQCAYPSKWLL